MLSKMRLMYIIDNFREIASASKSCAPTQYLHVKVFSRNGHNNQQCHMCASAGMIPFSGLPVDLISWSHCFQLNYALDKLWSELEDHSVVSASVMALSSPKAVYASS